MCEHGELVTGVLQDIKYSVSSSLPVVLDVIHLLLKYSVDICSMNCLLCMTHQKVCGCSVELLHSSLTSQLS